MESQVPESFDLQDYIDHVRARSRFIAIGCAAAAVLTVGITLFLPKQYTATTKLIIEPPAGSDPRASMAVSPIYLESLRTYEHFATSDSLFSQAIDHFQLRRQAPRRSLESWKSRVLKVTIPRNTKILEISATAEDPKLAHALALYLGEETIKLNRSITREGDREFSDDAARQLEPAKRNLEEAEANWNRTISEEPVETLVGEIEVLENRQWRAERDLLDTQVSIAGYAGREETIRADAKERLASARARFDHLRNQVKTIEQELAQKRALRAKRMARREDLDLRRKSARGAYESVLARARDTQAAVGHRGERLELVDPGIVPEKPSSPRMFVNVGAALLFTLVLSLFYVSFGFVYNSRRKNPFPLAIRRAGTGHD